ncbi:MAG: hypothetical protein EXR08_10960 [Alphaproteobacteria bacterium]|nr:hypothetical protein [Alphaproteobacteria bacterium]
MQDYTAIQDCAAFIWTAWGVAGALMLALWGSSVSLLRRGNEQIAALEAAQGNQTCLPHDP